MAASPCVKAEYEPRPLYSLVWPHLVPLDVGLGLGDQAAVAHPDLEAGLRHQLAGAAQQPLLLLRI